MKRIMAGTDKAHAARELESVADLLGPGAQTGLTTWHLVQTLSLCATLFEQSGNQNEAERVIREAVSATKAQLAESARAHADLAARLARMALERGEEAEFSQLVAEVLQSLALAPEPSLPVEQLLNEWRMRANRDGRA